MAIVEPKWEKKVVLIWVISVEFESRVKLDLGSIIVDELDSGGGEWKRARMGSIVFYSGQKMMSVSLVEEKTKLELVWLGVVFTCVCFCLLYGFVIFVYLVRWWDQKNLCMLLYISSDFPLDI